MNFKFEETKLVNVEFQRQVYESIRLLVPKSMNKCDIEDMVLIALNEGEINELDCDTYDDEINESSLSVHIESDETEPENLYAKIAYLNPDDAADVIVRRIRFDEHGNEREQLVKA